MQKKEEDSPEDIDMNPPESLLEDMASLFRDEINERSKEKKERQRRIFGEVLNIEVDPPDSLFNELSSLLKNEKIARNKSIEPPIKTEKESPSSPQMIEQEETIVKEKKEDSIIKQSLGLLANPPEVKTPDPLTPLNQRFATMKDLEDHYKLFLNRIQQQLSTLGGGGEANITYLDTPTTIIQSSQYQVKSKDYYIGVNHPGIVTITLPIPTEGKRIVVKDESGEASWKNRQIRVVPLSATDEIDGEDEAIIQIDHGSLTFIYREGWRII